MIPKPRACLGCPFYGDGRGFVPDELRDRASVFIVGQNPGWQEEVMGRPFVGVTGQEMERRYLKDAGLTRDDCSIGNVIRCRLDHKDKLPKITERGVTQAIQHCTREHFRIPDGTKLIVAQGDYAAMMLTGDWSSTEWRGYAVPYIGQRPVDDSQPWVPTPHDLPVLVTVHLARLYREPELKLPTRMDWTKVSRMLRRTWPRKPPAFRFEPIERWPSAFAFDTEYVPGFEGFASSDLVCYSMSWGTGDRQTAVVEQSEHERPVWEGRPRVITQYAPADVRHLQRLTGVKDAWRAFLIEDTVQKHAALYSDMPHDLNFLGSLFASINRWKHLAGSDPEIYSGCDALGTWEVDVALERELSADPRSRVVWEEIDRPAIEIFTEAQYAGLRTNPERVKAVAGLLVEETHDAQARATAACGWPINIGSPPQVAHRLFNIEKLKLPRAPR